MDALRLILRAELRRRWRPMLGSRCCSVSRAGWCWPRQPGRSAPRPPTPGCCAGRAASQLDLVSDQHSPAAFYHQLRALPQVAAMSLASYYDAVLPPRQGQAPAAARLVES